MSFPDDPRDTAVEMFAGGNWVDITDDAYGRDPLVITRGRGDESGSEPASCVFTLNNRSGKYSPRNPLSQYFGQLGRSTPIRVCVRTAKDSFNRSVTAGWASADTGHAYTNIGSGGTVQASDFNVNGANGTHSVPAVNAWRASYIPETVLKHRDVDLAVTVTVPISNVTGGNIEPANLMFQVSGTPTYYLIKVAITTAEAVTITVIGPSGSVVGLTVTVPGLTHSAGQALRVRAQRDARTIRVKVWPAAAAEPYGWHHIINHNSVSIDTISTVAGGVGIRSGVASGNTNTLPIVFSYDDFQVRVPRFAGEVGGWPQRWSDGATDAYVPLEAGGLLRRLGQGRAPLLSAPRRSKSRSGADYYWPLEDASLVTEGRPVLGNTLMRLTGTVPDQTRQWGQGELAPWLPSVLAREGLNSLTVGNIVLPTFTNTWTVTWAMAGGKANNDAYFSGATQTLRVEFSQSADTIRVHHVNASIKSVSYPQLFDDGPHEISFTAKTLLGFINWDLLVDGSLVLSSVSEVAGTLESLIAATFRNVVDNGSNRLAIGHFMINGTLDPAALFGHRGERAGKRIERLCGEENIPFTYVGPTVFTGVEFQIDSALVGPQYPDEFLALIDECVQADMGELYEPRGSVGLEYRSRVGLYNQVATAAFNFASDHLAPPLDPVDDDQSTRNDVTAKRRDGTEYQAELTTGPLSTADPSAGGIGRYGTSVTVNVDSDEQLPDVAGWLLHLGTVDDARYPQLTVNLARGPIANDPAMANVAMDLNIGDRITVDGASQLNIQDQISLIVVGLSESINADEHVITFNCVPESPYHVMVLDDSGSRMDSGASTLNAGITDSATSFAVAVGDGALWTTAGAQFPFDIMIGGERMTVDDITGSSSPQTFSISQRSVNGVVKPHSAGAKVQLFSPVYWGL